ncbi:unnamed protein product, partial [Symbiodinium sp. CCMP2456]
DRIPLPNIPWPILGAAPDSADALVEHVEKKHGPLGPEILKVQRSLRKSIRENFDDDGDDAEKDEQTKKPKAKSKAKAKAKAAKSKAKSKSKPAPEIEPRGDDVMSDAMELEKEEDLERLKVQQEEDATVKKAKGKRKKSKAKEATVDDEDKPAKPVKRRLDFEEDLEEEAEAKEDGAKRAPKCMRTTMAWASPRSVCCTWAVFLNHVCDGFDIRYGLARLSGAFYVSPVSEDRLKSVNEHVRAEKPLEANKKNGVQIAWEKGNLGDVQDKSSGCQYIPYQ